MHTQQNQSSGAQPQKSSHTANIPTPRPFEVTYPGQEIASSPSNPFPSRPHEVSMGESYVARKPDSNQLANESETKSETLDWNRISLYATGAIPPQLPHWQGVQAKLATGLNMLGDVPVLQQQISSHTPIGSSEIHIARQPNYTKDITKLDDTALQEEAVSLSNWFTDHTIDDPNYSVKLQAAVDLFVEISTRSGSPATAEDIEALKSRLVARSPRTVFEQRLRRGEFPAYKPVYDEGEVVGYSRSSGGYSEVVDLDGKIVWSDEIPLETPLLDPIDLIPFEVLGSLAIKAGMFGLRAMAKTGVKILTKDVGKVGVEEGIKLGAKGTIKVATGDISKSGLKALIQVFRKGEKLKSVGAVSLKRLRNILGRAGANPGNYKLVKVSQQVAEAMEKETGEIIWGWVERTGERVARDAKGRPIINFTPRALSSLEEAVKTFGHEAKHLKDFAAGLTTSSEALAEKEGEKLWLVVLESLKGK